MGAKNCSHPERVVQKILDSIPQIALVPLQTMLFEQAEEFLLKSDHPVMLLLIGNIVPDYVDFVVPERENPITPLP